MSKNRRKYKNKSAPPSEKAVIAEQLAEAEEILPLETAEMHKKAEKADSSPKNEPKQEIVQIQPEAEKKQLEQPKQKKPAVTVSSASLSVAKPSAHKLPVPHEDAIYRMPYNERMAMLAESAKKQKAQRTRLTVRRAAFTFGAVLICFCLSAGVKFYANSKGIDLPFASIGTSAPASEVPILEAEMPAGFGVNEESQDPAKPSNQNLWSLLLTNVENPLPAGYASDIKFVAPTHGSAQQLDSRAADALKNMFDAAAKDGIYLYFRSGYRSNDLQTALFNSMVSEYESGLRTGTAMTHNEAVAATKKWRNVPGTSEHETGLAADIVSAANPTVDLNAAFANTKEFEWLHQHCAEYGFILRYPEDKTTITGTSYEPWHYRYVGVEDAKKIMAQKICLEEYLEDKGTI